MRIEVTEQALDDIVNLKLREYLEDFPKWKDTQRSGIPHVSYELHEENKYRKRMRKAIKRLIEYTGG